MFYDRKRMELFSSTTEVLMGTVTPGDSLFLTLMCTTWYMLLSSLHFTAHKHIIHVHTHRGKVETWIFIHCEVCELRSQIHCSHSFPVLLWERVPHKGSAHIFADI